MPNFGLMSGNPYYSGPSGMAAGVNSFADNLMKAYGMFSGVRQRDEEIAIAKKYREQQEQLQAAQMDAIQQKSMEDAAVRSGQMNLRGNVNMPGLMAKGYVNPNTDVNAFSGAQDPALTPNLSRPDAIGSSDPVAMKQVAMGQTPQGMEGLLSEPTLEQRVRQYAVDDPRQGLKDWVALAGQKTESPGMGLAKTGKYSPQSIMDYIKTGDISKLELAEKPEKDDATTSLREFEMATGFSPESRGTPEYKNGYIGFLREKKQSITVRDGGKQPSEGELRYSSYVNQKKREGVAPMDRYQFDLWYDSQKVGGAAEGKADAQVKKTRQTLEALQDMSYQSPADVKKAVDSGKLTRDAGVGVLRRKFGMQ